MTAQETPSVEAIIGQWPKTARESAQTVLDKYGPPDEATPHMLAWQSNGPWKWSVITSEETQHDFPLPHIDVLEQAIDYRVPPERFSDLATFDGSVVADRTRGEISARCEGEEANFLAVNLAHDIVTGARTVNEARQRYVEGMRAMTEGRGDPYVEGLQFEPPAGDTGDPDEQVMES